MQFFFILSLGRSGTNLLANILNTAPNAIVHHEPYSADYQYLALGYYNPESRILKHMLENRFEYLLSQIPEGTEIYGESNSLLRYHVEWLKKEFEPLVIHLVRDGRDFVKSAYTRSVYTSKDLHLPIIPGNADKRAEEWTTYSRFQKLCWYWSHTNEYLMEHIEYRVKFEEITKDYNSFSERILKPTCVTVSPALYRQMIRKPVNTQKQQLFKALWKGILFPRKRIEASPLPHWTRWDNDLTEQFWDICGETMRKLHYV